MDARLQFLEYDNGKVQCKITTTSGSELSLLVMPEDRPLFVAICKAASQAVMDYADGLC